MNAAKKNALKISKDIKFERYLLKTNEGTAPQSQRISEQVHAPRHTNVGKISQFCEAISSFAFNALPLKELCHKI